METNKTKEFLQKLKDSGNWNDDYDYSKVDYINSHTKVVVIDKTTNTEHSILANNLLRRNPKCSIVNSINKEEYLIKKCIQKFPNFNYLETKYKSSESKVIIIDKEGFKHLIYPLNFLRNGKLTIESAIDKIAYLVPSFRNIHGSKYNYDKSEYILAKKPIIINCPTHGEFKQRASSHLSGSGCAKCKNIGQSNIEDFINKANKIHGDKYDYSSSIYNKSDEPIIINCPTHGEFKQRASSHLSGSGCAVCNNGFSKTFKLNLINQLELSDLLTMDPFEIYTIIGQGKLPVEFGALTNTDAGSEERIITLRELREQFEQESDEESDEELDDVTTQINDTSTVEIIVLDDVDDEITADIKDKPKLLVMNLTGNLHSLDNSLYATMDQEAFESLVQYKLRKLWNNVLNDEISLEDLTTQTGGKYFTMVRDMFLEEYEEANNYKPSEGYSFKYQPNLMQKLTVQRLLKNKSYGNWSGTGAGKTLSFIVASRAIDSRLTVIIALNSTIKQTCKVIKEVYPNSKTYTDYVDGYVFDRNQHNYLVLNYEKFQQETSEELFQSLTKNNQIDFVVIDEVHNAKQREEDNESIRRGVMNRLLGRIRESNDYLYVLAMSATPVVNNLYEAKSLLTLMSGIEYDDLNTRRSLPNALKIFQQLILNGLRYIPKYDIEMTELTGHNMSNLNIDGSHLLERLLATPQSNYIESEKILLDDKLTAIQPYLKKGVIIYTYFTTGFVDEIKNYVSALGYSVGTYTGDESTKLREDNLNRFISGDIDILIGSRPIGTGVDGLQDVCNRMIILTLPWTDSEYTQLKGRIYRQGSEFSDVEIVIPQVRIELGEGDFWSWDIQRLNLIKNKKTLADAAVDGIVPSRILPSKETMYRKSQESLERWKDRVNVGNVIDLNRSAIAIDLYPEIGDYEERQGRINSELSTFNQRGKITLSSTMHKEFSDNPESWFRYHALRREAMGKWEEVPYEYIATKVKNKNHKVVDFGCGDNQFKNCIPNNEVISFDHVSYDDSVIACDIRDVSVYLINESVDVCVFSLALWGTNYKEYISEAHRVLVYGGVVHIAEPSKNYEAQEDEQKLIDLITNAGFQVVGGIENRGKFIYVTGIKL